MRLIHALPSQQSSQFPIGIAGTRVNEKYSSRFLASRA
jgi:hypothetical protein